MSLHKLIGVERANDDRGATPAQLGLGGACKALSCSVAKTRTGRVAELEPDLNVRVAELVRCDNRASVAAADNTHNQWLAAQWLVTRAPNQSRDVGMHSPIAVLLRALTGLAPACRLPKLDGYDSTFVETFTSVQGRVNPQRVEPRVRDRCVGFVGITTDEYVYWCNRRRLRWDVEPCARRVRSRVLVVYRHSAGSDVSVPAGSKPHDRPPEAPRCCYTLGRPVRQK